MKQQAIPGKMGMIKTTVFFFSFQGPMVAPCDLLMKLIYTRGISIALRIVASRTTDTSVGNIRLNSKIIQVPEGSSTLSAQ